MLLLLFCVGLLVQQLPSLLLFLLLFAGASAPAKASFLPALLQLPRRRVPQLRLLRVRRLLRRRCRPPQRSGTLKTTLYAVSPIPPRKGPCPTDPQDPQSPKPRYKYYEAIKLPKPYTAPKPKTPKCTKSLVTLCLGSHCLVADVASAPVPAICASSAVVPGPHVTKRAFLNSLR